MSALQKISMVAVIFAIAGSCAAQSQPYSALVTGRVVDKLGRPVGRAIVSLESRTESRGDVPTYDATVETDVNGDFSVKNICDIPHRVRDLYVAGPFPEDAVELIRFPPTGIYRTSKPGLVVRSVEIYGNRPVDLGEIHYTVGIGIVELSLRNVDGSRLFESETDWRRAYYVLKDIHGRPFVAEGLSKSDVDRAVNLGNGQIRFAVPEGEWKIEFVADLKDLDSVIARTPVFSAVNGKPTRILANAISTTKAKPQVMK